MVKHLRIFRIDDIFLYLWYMITEAEYNSLIERIETIIFTNNTELEELVMKIQEYEKKYFPLPEPGPEDIKQFLKEQRGI
jgi:hypothetical protein